jgi:deoxyribodipyrimidine photo-lyase
MQIPSIMWFRQDLRLSDNAALTAASEAGPIIPLFILDDQTPDDWRWGGASRWWLHHSLTQLSEKLPLVLRRGNALDVLKSVVTETGADTICFTRDYAPWSGKLEGEIKAWCDGAGVKCQRYGGFLLHEPETIRNGSGEYFKVYTPFSKACFAKGDPKAPRPIPKFDVWTGSAGSENLQAWQLLPSKPDWSGSFTEMWEPGESGAHKRLHAFFDEGLADYADGRDRPDKPYTSRLSAHLHWGEISPAQVWHATRQRIDGARGTLDRSGEKFLKEILWREFSYHLIHHNPNFPVEPFRKEFADFPWSRETEALRRWQKGITGYPIVDAGMRQLWSTGTMHNRVRMIAASFLVKDLLIPWQEGERWFWDTLVDADIASNAASWQWVAGCGADAAPYFRIFNPVLQGEKFDPAGEYVRQWVPELRGVKTSFIHKPWELPVPPANYPKPMVDHSQARELALAAFKKIKKGAA